MKVLRRSAFAAATVAVALTLSACGSDEEVASESITETSVGTIVDVASGDGNFSTLVAAVVAADLVHSGQSPLFHISAFPASLPPLGKGHGKAASIPVSGSLLMLGI